MERRRTIPLRQVGDAHGTKSDSTNPAGANIDSDAIDGINGNNKIETEVNDTVETESRSPTQTSDSGNEVVQYYNNNNKY